jgi:hypothetical protein
MAIITKLDAAWATNETMDALFEFRAVAENAWNNLQEAVSRIDALTSSAKFTTVDTELKTEGVAVRKIINDAKVALDLHAAFLNWKQVK